MSELQYYVHICKQHKNKLRNYNSNHGDVTQQIQFYSGLQRTYHS